LCVIFPFEEVFFRRHGIAAEFVGHPLTEDPLPPAQESPDRVALIPGSRPREIQRLLPAIAGAARILHLEQPELRFVLPVAPGIDERLVGGLLSSCGVEAELVRGGAGAALAGARMALVASGTASLEAALRGVPMVVVYRVSRMTYVLVRPFFQLRHVCIVNILAEREVVPELLQGQVVPARIAAAARPLLQAGAQRDRQLEGLAEVRDRLGNGQPSRRVADALAAALAREAV
jgi:lipid-A-disaccharide synthase